MVRLFLCLVCFGRLVVNHQNTHKKGGRGGGGGGEEVSSRLAAKPHPKTPYEKSSFRSGKRRMEGRRGGKESIVCF